MTVEVGGGDWRFRLVDDWEKIPGGIDHPDVPGVAVGPEDRVYLFTRSEPAVLVYSSEGDFLDSWSAPFLRPHHLSISSDGSVYCVDKDKQVVEKFSQSGELLQTIGQPHIASNTGYVSPEYMSVIRAAGPFNGPATVTVCGDRLYVADGYGNARVHCFSSGGELLFSWGAPGEGPGEFRLPHSIAVSPDASTIYVADRENSRLQLFDADGSYLETWDDVARPLDIDVDVEGFVYVTELAYYVARYATTRPDWPGGPPSRVSIFNPDGRLVCRWGTRDQNAPGSFYSPHGVAVDSEGSIYVTEVGWTSGERFGLPPPDRANVQKFIRL